MPSVVRKRPGQDRLDLRSHLGQPRRVVPGGRSDRHGGYKYYDADQQLTRPCRRPLRGTGRRSRAAARLLPQSDRHRPHQRSVARPQPSRAPPPAGCRCLTSPIRVLPGVSRKMPKACASSPSATTSCWWRAPSPRTSASTTSGSVPSPWSARPRMLPTSPSPR